MATEVYLIAVLGAAIWSLRMVGLKLGLEEGGTSLQASLVVAFTDVVVYWGLLLALGRVDVFADVPLVGLGAFAPAGVVGTAPGRFASFGGIHRVGASVNSAGISPRPLFATALAFVLIDETVAPQVVGGILLLVGGSSSSRSHVGVTSGGGGSTNCCSRSRSPGRSRSRTCSGGGG